MVPSTADCIVVNSRSFATSAHTEENTITFYENKLQENHTVVLKNYITFCMREWNTMIGTYRTKSGLELLTNVHVDTR